MLKKKIAIGLLSILPIFSGGNSYATTLGEGSSLELRAVSSTPFIPKHNNLPEQYAKIDEEVMIKNGIEFRKIYGMNTSLQYISDVVDREKIDTDFEQLVGTPLSDAELEDYNSKIRVKEDVPTIKSIIKNNPNSYADIYYKPERGSIVVQVVQDTIEIKQAILGQIENKDKIEFQNVQFSKQEIEDAMVKIAKVSGGIVKAIIPDTINNKLIVSLDELTEHNKELVKMATFSPELITFIPSIVKKTTADESDYGNNFPLGSRIRGFNNDGSYYNRCSAGYEAVLENQTRVLVTAGHCDQVGSSRQWFQPINVNETSIGTFGYRTSSWNPDGSDAVSDSGYIVLTGDTSAPYVAYPDSTSFPNPNRTPISGFYTNDLVGDTTYARGATTGYLRSGTIKYANVMSWNGSSGYGYNNHEVWVDWIPMSGDSGGVVLANYRWDNNKQSWLFSLAGTVTSEITISGSDIFVDGTYGIYAPVWATYQDLNLWAVELM